MNKPYDWSEPTTLEQLRDVIDPPQPEPLMSWTDHVLNAVVYIGLVAALVFVVAVILGIIG